MLKRLLLAAPAALLATPAFAHPGIGGHASFWAGFAHPMTGLDHILAMVAVGLWAALIGGRALWLVPAAFVVAMTGGFALALAGIALPFVEPAILASVVILGLLVAGAVRLPAAAGMAIVASFALFHGHAHGGEMGAATVLHYASGFALATALLHLAGISIGAGLGRAFESRHGMALARAAGGATALAGVWLALS